MKVKPIVVVKKGLIRLNDRKKVERAGYLLIEVDLMDQVKLILPTTESLDLVQRAAFATLAKEDGVFGAAGKFGVLLAKALSEKKEGA